MQNMLFDFDGTLANSGATVALATQAAFRVLSLPEPSHDTIAYYMGIPIETSFKAMALSTILQPQNTIGYYPAFANMLSHLNGLRSHSSPTSVLF
ncbi:Uncharacterised protein [Weissella viridescens]|uniref:Phosphoglycolate phosphatase n=1 Tax=Weissella viridescens TaxID=1629 RepID=A0A380NYA6_WEIVI|nr:Uncharacterised protein [Weissella viridescens]